MKLRLYFLSVLLAMSSYVAAQELSWAAKAQLLTPTTRAISLADLGITDVLNLSDASDTQEQHFFFVIPHDARLKNVHIDLRAIFLRPFNDDAALNFSVNGAPFASFPLSGAEDNFSHPEPLAKGQVQVEFMR